MRKRQIVKTFRNTVIAIIALLVLAGGGGVLYVYLTGRSSEQPAQSLPPDQPRERLALPEPKKPNPNAPVSASVQSLITPVKAGSNTSLTVRTTAGAKCAIEVVYDKVKSEDSGLKAKVADDYGMVTWSWTVEKSAPTGTWPVKVTCESGKKSGYVEGNLEVK